MEIAITLAVIAIAGLAVVTAVTWRELKALKDAHWVFYAEMAGEKQKISGLCILYGALCKESQKHDAAHKQLEQFVTEQAVLKGEMQ